MVLRGDVSGLFLKEHDEWGYCLGGPGEKSGWKRREWKKYDELNRLSKEGVMNDLLDCINCIADI